MAPHADPIWVGIRIALHRSDGVEHIYGVAWAAISPTGLSLRPVVTAIVGPEDDIAAARDQVNIGDVAFRCPVNIWRDKAMIEDDHRPACWGFLPVGHCHEGIDFESFREIGN